MSVKTVMAGVGDASFDGGRSPTGGKDEGRQAVLSERADVSRWHRERMSWKEKNSVLNGMGQKTEDEEKGGATRWRRSIFFAAYEEVCLIWTAMFGAHSRLQ